VLSVCLAYQESAIMSNRCRDNWDHHVDEIIRSQHYTWLGEGLGGEPLSEALTDMMADIMHICRREGLSWERLVAHSRAQFEREEAEVARQYISAGLRVARTNADAG
jgi:hypothetical protein